MRNLSFFKNKLPEHILLVILVGSLFLVAIVLDYFLTLTSTITCRCLGPTFWSTCTNNIQSRVNQKCDSSTNYQCQPITETQFCTLNYTLTMTSTTGGTTDPVPGTYSFISGNTITLTASPSSGYLFRYWIVNGQNAYTLENSITINLTTNLIVQAVFALNQPPPPPPPPGTPAIMQWYNVPSLIESNQSAIVQSCFVLGNPGQVNVTNVSINLTGIDPNWYSLLPLSFQDLSPNLNASVCMTINIPPNAAVKDYQGLLNASDNVSTSANFILRVDPYIYLNSSPPPPPKNLTFNITTCGDIVTGGNYFLSQDIVSQLPPNWNYEGPPCVRILDTQGVDLNCEGHSITGNGSKTAYFRNVENFSMENCSLQSINSTSLPFPITLLIVGSNFGNITNNRIGAFYTSVMDSSNLIFKANKLNSSYQQISSSFNTFADNVFSVNSDFLLSSVFTSTLGKFNNIINNTIQGSGNFGGYLDDVIFFNWENSSNISSNIISNAFDCGFENIGLISNITIMNNTFSNFGRCGIGGWYFNGWLGNTISNNIINNTGSMFIIDRYFGLITDPNYGPVEDKLYFANNTFTGNIWINPTGNLNLPNWFSMIPGIYSYNSWSKNISANDTVTENNVFTRNDFTRTYQAPYFNPYSMIVDGGKNICSMPANTTGYPLNCWRGKP